MKTENPNVLPKNIRVLGGVFAGSGTLFSGFRVPFMREPGA